MQAKPLGYWRNSETNLFVTQDYSGYQSDLTSLYSQGWLSKTTSGVYIRAGGSGLDNDGAGFPVAGQTYYISPINDRHLTFDTKLTYSVWVNMASVSAQPTYLFVSNSITSDMVGVVFRVTPEGYLWLDFNRARTTTPNYVRSAQAILPGSLNTTIQKGWYHITMTFDGSQTNGVDKVQFFVNGSPVSLLPAVGTIPSSLTTLMGPPLRLQFSTHGVFAGGLGSTALSGFVHDEDAIYDRVLPINEIRAQANEGSLRYCDIPVTSTHLPLSSRPFDYINMLFDGTTLNIRRNSYIECAMRIGNTSGINAAMINLSPETLTLTLGASSNGFAGHIADLRIHGADSSPAATASNAYSSFINSMDQHRIYPYGDIVTTDLVRSYEASAALDGVRPHPEGCATSAVTWRDIAMASTTGARQEPGYLRNFEGCTTTGWKGDGTPGSPYRLSFDGVNDWVDLGTALITPTLTDKLTACVWVRTTQVADTSFFNRGGSGWGEFNVGTQGNQAWLYSNATAASSNLTNLGILRNGNWHYLCGRYNGAALSLIMDGTSIGTAARAGAIPLATDASARMTLGRIIHIEPSFAPQGTFFSGDIGAVHVYNASLTDDQIKQNCAAQAANYNMSTCAP